jgi:predicted nicotinamide N-methyase
MTTMRTVSLQVPEDAVPGDSLSFSVDGQEMEMLIPTGSEPGDILQIQVGANDDDETNNNHGDSKEDTITKLDLGGERILEFSSELPAGYCDDEKNNDNDENNDGTYALPWRSAKEIAKRWKEIRESLVSSPPKRVLELGAGLGLVGMSFAIDGLSGEGADIILTDLPIALPLLNHNIECNKSLLPPNLCARPLRWSLERHENDWTNTEPPFDCILGSDLLYNVEYIPHLVATLKRLLHPTRGVVILAARWRKPELERDFFRDMDLDWTLIPSADSGCCCNLSWQEFGDPSSAESNKYFHQTQISIKGKPKSLADITEEEAQNLTTAEFEAWERGYIQIYLGKAKEQSNS